MTATRPLPVVGASATIQYFGHEEMATIVRVEGTSVWVQDAGGEQLAFELRRLTAHFVLHDEPYWGTRLRLG